MYRKFREVWTCDFQDIQADRHADIQTRWSQCRGRSKECCDEDIFTDDYTCLLHFCEIIATLLNRCNMQLNANIASYT